MRMRRVGVVLFQAIILVVAVSSVHAQIQVDLSAERTSFLLYEPLELTVRATNLSNEPIILSGDGGAAWLDFLVMRADGSVIRREQVLEFSAQQLAPSASVSRKVDITPLFSIRDSGQYQIRAVVRVPGREDFITSTLRINIGRGIPVWTKTFNVDGVERVVTVLRFLDRKETSIYLRVEHPKKNEVYPTRRLGTFVAFTDVKVEIDDQFGIHVLQPVGPRLYRYTLASPMGDLLHQEEREVSGDVPRLSRLQDGAVVFTGGRGGTSQAVARSARQRLSELQQGM